MPVDIGRCCPKASMSPQGLVLCSVSQFEPAPCGLSASIVAPLDGSYLRRCALNVPMHAVFWSLERLIFMLFDVGPCALVLSSCPLILTDDLPWCLGSCPRISGGVLGHRRGFCRYGFGPWRRAGMGCAAHCLAVAAVAPPATLKTCESYIAVLVRAMLARVARCQVWNRRTKELQVLAKGGLARCSVSQSM